MIANWKINVLLSVFLISGCTATIEGQSLRHNPEEAKEIKEKCHELKKIGNVSTLSDKIDAEMGAIEEILTQAEPTQYEIEIKSHASRVRNYTSQLIEVLNSEYATPNYMQYLRWEINDSIYEPVSGKIENVFLWNGEDSNLAKQFDIKISRSGLRVQLIRPASLIEICQLEKLMNVVLAVTYKNDWGGKETLKYRLKMKEK